MQFPFCVDNASSHRIDVGENTELFLASRAIESATFPNGEGAFLGDISRELEKVQHLFDTACHN